MLGAKTGIGYYTQQILLSWLNHHQEHEYILYTPEPVDFPLEAPNWRMRMRNARPGALWVQKVLPGLLFEDKPDIFWGPNYAVPILRPLSTRMAMTIHDLAVFTYPSTMMFRTLLHNRVGVPIYAPLCDAIFSVSMATRSDIVAHIPVDSDRVHVTPLAPREHFGQPVDAFAMERVRDRYGLGSGPYILSVGSLEPRKNIGRLVAAYERLIAESSDDVKLVLVGQKAWKSDALFESIQRSSAYDRIILTGYVDDLDMPALYAGATVFVYPSLYEGFGLPIIEAMAAGVPVITSGVSSMPEVAGSAALLVNPLHVADITQALRRVLADATLRQQMRSQSLQRAQEFSWRTTADSTMKGLVDCVEPRGQS